MQLVEEVFGKGLNQWHLKHPQLIGMLSSMFCWRVLTSGSLSPDLDSISVKYFAPERSAEFDLGQIFMKKNFLNFL